ncbi:MAG TPA: HAD family phosphatase [Candidatus Atribacteria bacterium]|nr:HAD family phosphatase [Candidatus Atribacteria bacterium]
MSGRCDVILKWGILMKNIKTIVYDYGGVISKKQNKKLVYKMCNILNIPEQQFFSFYGQERKDYDSALIDAKTYWMKTIKLIGGQIKSKDIDRLIEFDAKSWLDINKETIEYIKSIQGKIKLALLSNMTFDVLEKIKTLYWIHYFDSKIFSCEEKVAKPDEKIYEVCLKKVKIEPQHILFIDDSEVNLIAAQRMGINILKFTDCENMKNIIENEYVWEKIERK